MPIGHLMMIKVEIATITTNKQWISGLSLKKGREKEKFARASMKRLLVCSQNNVVSTDLKLKLNDLLSVPNSDLLDYPTPIRDNIVQVYALYAK